MARIRTLKPEFWADEKLSLLDPLTRLVFLGLVSLADDAGRLVDNVKWLDGQLFPNTDDSTREPLDTLARLSRITRYTSASGQNLIQLTNWDRHQKVDKPSKHTLPAPTAEQLAGQWISDSSRDSRENVASESRDSRAPTLDLGPRTNDLGPTTNSDTAADASAAAGDVEAEVPAGRKRPGRPAAPRRLSATVEEAAVIAHHRERHPRRRPPDDKVLRRLRRALADGYDVETLKLAVDGNADDAWCVETGNQGLGYILRDHETLERFAEKARRDNAPAVGPDGTLLPEARSLLRVG